MVRKLLVVAGVLVAGAFSANVASAQVSCSGLPAFASCTAYASGTAVTYNGSKYTAIAPIPNNRDCPPNSPYNPSTDNWWVNNGTCTTTATATATRTATPTTGATATRTSTATATTGATATRTNTATATARTGATATRTPTARAATATRTATATATRTATATATTGTGSNNAYQAAYWTQNNDPCTNSGAPGSGEEWNPIGACSGQAAWNASTAYNGGAQVCRTCGGTNPTATATPQVTVGATPTRTSTGTATPTSATPTPTACTNCPVRSKWLVGYWHNFDNGSGSIQLKDVSNNWDVINVSFAEPTSPTSGDMRFAPFNTTQADFISQVALLKSRGKKVVISIGGANGQVQLGSTGARDTFVSTMTNIIRTYGFDGLDIDFEGHSFILNEGDNNINAPTTPVLVNTISAIRSIRSNIGTGMYLSFAPETFFVQLGFQFYGGNCLGCDRRAGSYLPVIQALRNELTILHVQDYNSGSIMGLDGQYYSMGNSTFHIKMTEMLLQGFPVMGTGQTFAGLPPGKVGFGVPATVNAGNGFTSNAEVQAAYSNLNSRFPGVRGIMSWSINWDQFAGFAFSNSHRAFLGN